MNKFRGNLAFFIGWLFVIYTVLMLGFSVLLYFLGAPPFTCIFLACSCSFPALLATACLKPSTRTGALRIIGVLVCIISILVLIVSFVEEPDGPVKRGIFIMMAIAGAVMAIRGKWPDTSTQAIGAVPIIKSDHKDSRDFFSL